MTMRSSSVLLAAVTWLLLASPAAVADFLLGKRVFDSWNMKVAAAEFERATQAGDARSARYLSRMYGMGYIGTIENSRDWSMHYLIRAAELGDTEAKGLYGAALLRPIGGVRGPDGAWKLDVEKGLTLLKLSCESIHGQPCFHLAELYASGRYSFDVVKGLPTPDADESKRWGSLYRRAVLAAAESGSATAMLSLAHRQPSFWWLPVIQPDERALFAALNAFATGRPIKKPSYLGDISDQTYASAVPAAETWEVQRRIRPATFEPSPSMAARVARAIGWTDTVTDDDIDRIALSYSSQFAGSKGSGLTDGVLGESARKLATELRPLFVSYFNQRKELLESQGMDAQTWLTRALSESLSPRQLFLLDQFYGSQLGRKLLSFEHALLTVGMEASIVLSQLLHDPNAAIFGTDYSSRHREYAKRNGITLTLDQRQDGAEKRFEFLRAYFSFGTRVILRPFVTNADPRFAGLEYERVSRMLTPDEMDEVTAFRTPFLESGADNAVRKLQAARAENAELASLERKMVENILKRAIAAH